MRTTITLDPDVEAMLKKVMQERDLSFKQAVNSLLRSALLPNEIRPDYSWPVYRLGKPLVPLEHALQLASEFEDEEIARKMTIGR
jgi:hypothetical protein